MNVFLKSTGLALVTLILGLSIEKKEKDYASLLSLTACCILAATALTYLEPVWTLLWKMDAAAGLQDGILEVLLKASGIGLVTELAGMICADSGNGSLAKVLRILGGTVILNLSLPIMETLYSFIQEMLGSI